MGAHPSADAAQPGIESHTSHGRIFQYRENRILSALPGVELERLTPHLTRRTLEFKMPLGQPGEPITTVCFPDSGVCSVMAVMRNGASAEVATVGNEGLTGIGLFFGETEEPSESLVQVPGIGRFLPADIFVEEMKRRATLHQLVAHYAHALMIQLMQSAACNALHSVDQRTCKWILMTHDRVFSDHFTLTHEFLGLMLGVGRPTLSQVAGRLQAAGLITYRHGRVTVLDRAGLESRSCECHAIVARYFDAFLRRLNLV
jgi:CRP-like cAMP-binding protein